MLTNRPEFHLADAAAMHLGAIPFSMYNTSSPEQVDFLLRDSGAKVAVVEEQFRDRVDAETVIDAERLDELEPDDGFDFDAAWQAVEPDDPLTLIYTSGTTGDPKGVVLTHKNMLFTMRALRRGAAATSAAAASSPTCRWRTSPSATARTTSRCCSASRSPAARTRARSSSYFPEVRPSWFFAVPRIFEKLKAAIESGPPREDPGRPPRAARDGPARARSTSAPRPCPPEVIEFFHGIGLPLGELWGMSETNAIGACNPPDNIKIGTVGPAVPGVEIRLAEDGEIELRGDCVFAGYFGQEEKTRETFTDDGWLMTGDVGELDDDGYLKIVDRKKELIINAAGKNMSPANIESTLKAEGPLIGSVVVIGDRRPYNVALIVPDPDAAAGFDGSVEDADRRVGREGQPRLSNVEQIKRHTVLDTEWEPGGDELTPTMKIKRKPIAEKYADEIEGLYER